ncbi:MAG: UDP-N-acetylmuramate:L-alanyl-gamma-D-glutamyl-meso-diaminopimelate ligase [Gemmatimonadetes bacterium]|jgi:UDP-N-acetylmuramate: L-alanyl-gamma-D-glutamyl-meso-diaminopimelate ligase|nr:UDP-N-acetylmuramate:L-alanyl-gamma-D-glutamyl-meso-diaminopimelate ligase [Gemmatimonadota bacterium]MBT6146356.1 UDP-N-acetylmuramate:L-alanyl-gamma-D-glutamyl-meso-diaminopimelate ligase [Gemmatimonadota bacterium]MBT7862859.1 UDP-N-acetylmuramate:L-alanyl-gamma-D-glutamyl-meso-diaminopimelate ligase [Gemmatimonadota bacterium]
MATRTGSGIAVRTLKNDAHIHLIAACGTAMGSLAGLLRTQGYRVTGSDTGVYPPMSDFLAAEGIEIQTGFDAAHLDPEPDLVIVGNAVSRGNIELEAVLARGLPYTSLPEALRDLFLHSHQPIVVAGTHGKTTTTALTAWLLAETKQDPSYLVAGLPRDVPRPYHLGTGRYFVVEGDEYDSAYFAKFAKFLFYRPQILVVNNIEFDHADIYRDLAEIVRAFRQVVNQVPGNGLICGCGDDPLVQSLLDAAPAPALSFGFDEGNDWRAVDVDIDSQGQSFGIIAHGQDLGRWRIGLPGAYNIHNALAALSVVAHTGIATDDLRDPLRRFTGVRRRQEELGIVDGVRLIDDFAHHPTAVGQTLQGLRAAYPEGRLWAVFEPASASNARQTFEDRYLAAFEPADAVLLAPVPRPERAGEDPPFSSARLAQRLCDAGKQAWSEKDADAISQRLVDRATAGDTIVFMSNGGFGSVQAKTSHALSARR